MRIFYIYRCTNLVNGKTYIGYSQNWKARKSAHKGAALLRNENTKFYRAIRKWGWDNFIWEVVYVSKDAEHTLKEMEPYFINKYDTYTRGYNATQGGEGTFGFQHSDVSRNKMSLSWTKSKRAALSTFRKGKDFSTVEGRQRSIQALKQNKQPRSSKHQKTLDQIHQKYQYHTPFGVFNSIKDANQHPNKTCSMNTIRNRCLQLTKPKTGSWKDCGFYTTPACLTEE